MTTEIKVPSYLGNLYLPEQVIKEIRKASKSNMSPEEKTNISNKFTDVWCRRLREYNCEDKVKWCTRYKSKLRLRKKDGSYIRDSDFCNDWLDKNSNLEKTIYSDICYTCKCIREQLW